MLVEHIFAMQKDKMELFIRTIGIGRATMKIGMANIVYNVKRLVFLGRLAAADLPALEALRKSPHAPRVDFDHSRTHAP